jgi:Holliday junction resolvasome RuvABC endonuclease subunit
VGAGWVHTCDGVARSFNQDLDWQLERLYIYINTIIRVLRVKSTCVEYVFFERSLYNMNTVYAPDGTKFVTVSDKSFKMWDPG